jgi:excisionase family DNA binding protein
MSQRVDESPRAALTVRQVAGHLNVNECTAYRVAEHGDLPAFKAGDTWRYRPEDIDA